MNYEIYEGGCANGTCLQDYMVASYDQLVQAFGEPTYGDASADGKVNVEWVLTIENENESYVATVYNWKDYDGGREARTNPEYRWHIGGHSSMAALILKEEFAKGVSA